MKEDILEQLVDDYLQARGYFTRHNLKFKPRKDHPSYSALDDSNCSDIDVLGYNPNKLGVDRVWVVSCKSWQSGFRVKSKITEIDLGKISSGRAAWKAFRELTQPKWSEAFRQAVYDDTGERTFTYITAVTRIIGPRELWEKHEPFRKSLGGNPIKLLSLDEMLEAISTNLKTTLAGSDFGRTVQLLKASGVLK